MLKLLLTFLIGVVTSSAYCSDFVSPDAISYDNAPGFKTLQLSQDTQASLVAPKGLRIKWLGTAGFEISDDQTTILVDPFVSRPGYVPVLLFQKLAVDTEVVDHYVLDGLDPAKIKVILNSHTHHDHVLDIPYILSTYPNAKDRPLVVGDSNVRRLLEAYDHVSTNDVPWLIGTEPLSHSPQMIVDFTADEKYHPQGKVGTYIGDFGDFKVTAFINNHTHYDDYPWLKFVGEINSVPPMMAGQYLSYLDSSLNYLIEYKSGFRIFATDVANFLNADKVAQEVGHVDLLLQGIAARKNEDDTSRFLAAMQPRYFIPTHYDDFFRSFRGQTEFDFRILMPQDQSRLADFESDFNRVYVPKARLLAGDDEMKAPKLRLVKLFYYYSLVGL
jgi:L-ascorbate metabolism protein UlaG (beta-lactamase superfamily)